VEGCYYHFKQGPVIIILDRDQWRAVIITLDRDQWWAVVISYTGTRKVLLLSLWKRTDGGLLLSSAQGPEQGYY